VDRRERERKEHLQQRKDGDEQENVNTSWKEKSGRNNEEVSGGTYKRQPQVPQGV
jgi:hypothetical protein